jgi:RNA polymerase sigma-70 factor (ECF subfamily)
MSADTLEQLLEKLCQGDTAAAEEVFRTYEPYLRKVVRRQLPAYLRPKFDSADVVQSTWADLIRGFREDGWRFPDADRLRAFLVTTTKHRFIDRLRRYRTAAEREQPLPDDTVIGLHSTTPSPSQVAQADELWEKMLALCPPAHRELLLLKRQGLPMHELVARTGLHEDSIRRIFRQLELRVAFAPPPVVPEPSTEP